MKKTPLILYITSGLALIIMARLIFLNTGRLAKVVAEPGILDQIRPAVQNLYILQSLLLFVPFLIIIYMIFREINSISAAKKAELLASQQKADQIETVIQEDSEELIRQREEQLQQEAETRKSKLHECLNAKLKKDKPSTEKAKSEAILSCLSSIYEITQAEIFLRQKSEETDRLILSSTYAFYVPDEKVFEFEIGEGLIGQVAKAGTYLYMDELPEGYITVKSGLGSATPSHLLIVPWKDKEGNVNKVMEIASFKPFHKPDIDALCGLSEKIIEIYE